MSKYPLEHEAGIDRRFFESETTFYGRDDLVTQIINAYHLAAETAARSARSAIAHGGQGRLDSARWDEAVAQTLERVLALLPGDADGERFDGSAAFIMPELPGPHSVAGKDAHDKPGDAPSKTLRDECAMRAVQTMLDQVYDCEEAGDTQRARFRNMARDAYLMADVMLWARNLEGDRVEPVQPAPELPMSAPLCELRLTVRTHSLLEKAGIRTLHDLCRRSEVDLLKMRDFGKRSLDDVKSELAARGMSLGMVERDR